MFYDFVTEIKFSTWLPTLIIARFQLNIWSYYNNVVVNHTDIMTFD